MNIKSIIFILIFLPSVLCAQSSSPAYPDSLFDVADVIDFTGTGNRVIKFNYSNTIEDIGEPTTLTGQSNRDIKSMATSPDNKYFAQGSMELVLWDVYEKTPVYTLRYHKNYITSIVFSPDNNLIITGDRDGIACVVDISSGKLLKKMYIHRGGISSLTYGKDGKFLITTGLDKVIRVWDTESWKSLRKILAPSSIKSVTVSLDAKWMGITLLNGKMQVYDLQTSLVKREYGGDSVKKQEFITKIVFSPQGDKFYTIAQSGDVIVWNLTNSTIMYKLVYKEANSMYSFFEFCPEGKRYITADFRTTYDKGYIRSWDSETNEIVTSLKLITNSSNFYTDGMISEDRKNLFLLYQDAKSETSDIVLYKIEMSHLLCE